ncbi:MAG: DUF917 domain-containing protein [Pseudomonadota bacterium]
MLIRAEDIPLIALGGAFLATGGGGDTLLGEIIAEDKVRAVGTVRLEPLDRFTKDHLIVAIGGVGSPTIMQEKPMNGHEAVWALEALEAVLGKRASGVIAFEAGGMNALVPFEVAADRGLPVVDADGMGRAFPELQMESFSIYGVSATPMAMAAELGDCMVVTSARSPKLAETLVRHFSVAAGGGQCISAEHVMDGETAQRVAIPGTISLCRDIGILIDHHGTDVDGFLTALSARLRDTHYGKVVKIAAGKITDLSREVRGGYDFATIALTPHAVAGDFAASNGEAITIMVKNEYLLAHQAGVPLATTPDLICLLDSETGRPITAETLRYGQRVAMVAIGAPALMRTQKALPVVCPRAFGFDHDYCAIEALYPDDMAQ